MLTQRDFQRFVDGQIKKKDPIYVELVNKGFVGVNKKSLVEQAAGYLSLHRSVTQGPALFIFVLTLRCNHRCVYCQVTPERPKAKGFDMDESTARRAVDLIFRTPSPSIHIEFQGGEPVLNWSTLVFIVKYAQMLNQDRKRVLKISLVTNLTLLDEEKVKFLLANRISISCSFDGPAKVHNKNRIYLEKGASHTEVSKHIRKIQKAIVQQRKATSAEFVDVLTAILTVSKHSLPFYKEIVDEYMKMGFNSIFIRPLSLYGLAKKTLPIVGYNIEEFFDFYRKALDYILKLNLGGKFFIERNAYYVLAKIINGTDPCFTELISPCGAGIEQMAINYDGRIFTCDEGRMVSRMGYDNFQIGNVHENDGNFNQLIDNSVTKTMCLASCLDNHVSCSDCVYKPYCGICPLANFLDYGTIFPSIPNTDKCKMNIMMFDYFFQKAQNKKYMAIFKEWLAKGPYLHNVDLLE